MDLTTCMKKTTHRQYLTWMAWLEGQWNRPNVVCHYLMQVACEIRRVLSKDPNKHQNEQFKIKFETQSPIPEKKVLTEAEKAAITMRAKSAWCAITGFFNRKQ